MTEHESTESFQIVILGTMNPRLHHPLWYKAIGLLNEDELRASVSAPLTCSQEGSVFHVLGIQISCAPDRWDIATNLVALRPRILGIAKEVFTRLHETPIPLFAFNNDFIMSAGHRNVLETLIETVARTGIAPPNETA